MRPTTTAANRAPTVEKDLDELSSLLWETFRGLKQSSPPPQELRDAAARGSLGPRHMPALLAVAAAGPLSVSELARRLGLGLSTHERDRRPAEPRGPARARRGRQPTAGAPSCACTTSTARSSGSWAEQTLAPLRGTLERLSPRARAQFMEGWRILHEEATRAAAINPERPSREARG